MGEEAVEGRPLVLTRDKGGGFSVLDCDGDVRVSSLEPTVSVFPFRSTGRGVGDKKVFPFKSECLYGREKGPYNILTYRGGGNLINTGTSKGPGSFRLTFISHSEDPPSRASVHEYMLRV